MLAVVFIRGSSSGTALDRLSLPSWNCQILGAALRSDEPLDPWDGHRNDAPAFQLRPQ